MVLLIPLAYAALGAFGVVVQTILLREFFVVAAGNEVSFGIAMAGWLLGVGAGSLAGAFFSSRRSSTAAAFAWAALALVLAAPLMLAAARNLHRLAGIPQGALMPLAKTFLLVPLISLPFSALSGFAFPLAAGLRPLAAGREPRTLTAAYSWEALGAVAGGALYTFWLVGRSDPVQVIALFALPLLLGSGAVAIGAAGRRPLALILLVLAVDLAALLAGGTGRFESWLVRQRWRGVAAGELAAARDSRFQNLQLGLSRGQYSLFANGQLATVFPEDEANEVLAAQLLTQHPRPRAVLVIGDASGGLAKHLLRYPISSLTVVEIDAEFTRLVRDHLSAADRSALGDPRLRMRAMDGRRFVLLAGRARRELRERYDLAFINQPDAWTAQLNRYYTREFFLDLKRVLAPGGVVALHLASAENYASEIVTPYTAVIFRTLKSVFPAVALSPGMSNFFFASGSRSRVSEDPARLAGRYRALAPAPAPLAPVFASLYPAEKTRFIRAALERIGEGDLNRDDRPIAYFLGSRLIGWSSGTPLSGLFAAFQGLTLPYAVAAMALLLLPLAALALARRSRGIGTAAPLLASACGGFAGLSFEITAIFVFQNAWGFVYQAVGMLIALFMLGLGAGAAWGGRWIDSSRPSPAQAARRLCRVLLLIALIGLACLPLLGIYFRQNLPRQLLLTAWLGIMGLLVGMILPLGLRVIDRRQAGRSAGILNAGDYLGGAAGSLLMAAFFLPLLGTRSSLFLISFLALAAAALLFAVKGRGRGGA